MLRNICLIGFAVLLSSCASSGSLAVRSVTDGNVVQATKSSIIAALDGGLFGRLEGESVRRSDRMLALEAEYRALEYTPAGQPVTWKSDSRDLTGEVVASQPYRVGSQDCRPYRHTVSSDGASQSVRGTACRSPDGSWTPLT
ncbi:MAG: hypothetical protein AB3N20_08930 [Rhizobiaceae bacterium]